MVDKPNARRPESLHSLNAEIRVFICFMGLCFLTLAPLSLAAFGVNGPALFFFATGLMLVGWQLAKKFDAFSMETLLFFVSLIYIYAAFIDFTIFENSKEFDIDYVMWITVVGMTMIFSFVTGVYFFKTPKEKPDMINPIIADKMLYSCMAFNVLALAAYLNFAWGYLGMIGFISRGELYLSVPLSLELVKLALPILLLIGFVSMVIRVRRTSLTIKLFFGLTTLFFVAIEILVFGDRRISLSLILCLIVLRNLVKPIPGFLLLAMPAIAAAFVLMGYFRNQSFGDFNLIWENITATRALNPVNTEFGAFHIVGRTLFEEPFAQSFSFTVFQVPFALIPSALFPGRPSAPSVAFVRDHFADIYASGGGLAYNLVVEFYQNFWYFGPIFLGLILARAVTLIKVKTKSYFTYLILWNIFFAMRMDLVSLIRNVLMGLVILGMVRLIAALIFRVKS